MFATQTLVTLSKRTALTRSTTTATTITSNSRLLSSLLNTPTTTMAQQQHKQQQQQQPQAQAAQSQGFASLASASDAVSSLKGKDFMSIDQLSKSELEGLLDLSHYYKQLYSDKSQATTQPRPLTGCSMSMIFQKRSTRTRVSTETGMSILGGHALFLGPSDIQLGVNESMRDTASVLSRFNDLILARVYGHDDVVELAKYSDVPVINALSHLHHPLQTLADLMTLQEHFGKDLAGQTLAWVGDGNNVLHDLMLGSAILGMNVNIATPVGYEPNATILAKTKALAAESGATITSTTVASEAVRGATVVVTDTWISMGEEDQKEEKLRQFEGYQVNSTLMGQAQPNAVFLHCLPRHPEEVADQVFYSEASLVFPEAENRMWTVMSTMAAQLGKL